MTVELWIHKVIIGHLPDSHQAVIGLSLDCHLTVIRYSSGSHQAVIIQSSDNYQTVISQALIRQSSGSHQATIRQSSLGSHLTFNWQSSVTTHFNFLKSSLFCQFIFQRQKGLVGKKSRQITIVCNAVCLSKFSTWSWFCHARPR